jgi:hypothetical protein
MPASPSPARLKTEADLQQYILLTLGAPQVKVELVQEDLEEAIDEARRWFNAKKGFKTNTVIDVFANVTEYQLPEEIDVVIDISLPSRPTDFSRVIDPLGLLDASIPYNLFPHPSAGGLFSTYAQALQYIELSKRITGGEVEWSQDGRTLFLFPIPKETGKALILGKSNNFTLEQLSERDHDLVKRYALAWARRKLGMVRKKYQSGWPGAQGVVQLDGDALYAEATQELANLTEELDQSGFPLGFLTG